LTLSAYPIGTNSRFFFKFTAHEHMMPTSFDRFALEG